MRRFKQYINEVWGKGGTKHAHIHSDTSFVNGDHKVETYFAGGKGNGYPDGTYGVSFAVNNKMDADPKNPNPHAVPILRHVVKKAREFARRNPDVEKLHVLAMDSNDEITKHKDELYKKILKKHFGDKNIGQSGDAITARIR